MSLYINLNLCRRLPFRFQFLSNGKFLDIHQRKSSSYPKMTILNSESAMVDALPYIDQGYDEVARTAALALIEEECQRFRPTKNYLAHLPVPKFDEFETEVMKNEFERIQNRQPMEMLNMKRYDLNPPPAGKITDVGAWQEAVVNSQAQLEHQALRVANMDLMAEYGAEAWKVYNEILQRMLNQAQSQLNSVRKEIQEVNFDRKQKQMAAGEKLKKLEESWVGLVSKNFEIERACCEIEKELAPLKKKFKKNE